MTVGQLIAILAEFDDDQSVMVRPAHRPIEGALYNIREVWRAPDESGNPVALIEF